MTQNADSPALRSPLDAVHAELGASFTDFAGWRMPVSYSSDLAEHAAVRTAAGLFDLSHMAEIAVLGPQAAPALDAALADPVSGIANGRAKYTLLEDADGGILDDLIVYRTGDDRFLVVANAGNRHVVADALRERIGAHASPSEALVEDETDDVALIALQGPLAEEILRNVEGFEIPELDGLGYYRSTSGDFLGHGVFVARTGYTGEDGFEFYLAPEAAESLWTALLETGEGSGLKPAGLAARDSLRLEAGMPLYGHELDRTTRREGIGRAARLVRDGRVLVGLTGEGRRAARAGYAVVREGDPVGGITSGALSPTLGHPIAMAYVDAALAEPGTVLAVDVRGTELPVTVVDLPFYRRPKEHA
ncbi:glycine cleavage system aminomethyltransferase GcvT [Pseudolysinimonas kribbensis]|uniref:glycine cleavage system aminomethyltransferase GcvT n=1 Tax=Pseudolysinimonas kribbensis TaxID=433641 RepID=UPI0031D577C3